MRWIALHAGIAGGAHTILLPEMPYDPRAVWQRVTSRLDAAAIQPRRRCRGARPSGGDYAISEEREHPSALPVLGGGVRLACRA